MTNFPVLALVDSDAKQNLISKNPVNQLQILVQELTQPVTIAAFTGKAISSIYLKPQDLHFVIVGNHHDTGEIFCVRLLYLFGLHLARDTQPGNQLG